MEKQLNENDVYELSEFFKNLSDFSRVKIITSLLKGEKCVQDIADDVDMTNGGILPITNFKTCKTSKN